MEPPVCRVTPAPKVIKNRALSTTPCDIARVWCTASSDDNGGAGPLAVAGESPTSFSLTTGDGRLMRRDETRRDETRRDETRRRDEKRREETRREEKRREEKRREEK